MYNQHSSKKGLCIWRVWYTNKDLNVLSTHTLFDEQGDTSRSSNANLTVCFVKKLLLLFHLWKKNFFITSTRESWDRLLMLIVYCDLKEKHPYKKKTPQIYIDLYFLIKKSSIKKYRSTYNIFLIKLKKVHSLW